MKPLYLKFSDKMAAENALLDIGFTRDESGVLQHDKIAVDVIGIIHGAIVMGEDGTIISQDPDLPGWHVNLLVPDDYVIESHNYVVTVETPVRKWAGY